MRTGTLIALATLGWLRPALAAPFVAAPAGYTLVAEDDCGSPDGVSHVVRGKDYVLPAELVAGTPADRDLIFDDEFCLLRYPKLSATAAYKVDVVYVSEVTGARQQALEANGVVVHETMPIPGGTPGRFIFDLPRAAYSGGQPLELKLLRKAGANAVVSYVRIWSADPRTLPGLTSLWVPKGSVEKDWLRQDRLRGKPTFSRWENPAQTIRDSVVPCINEQLARGRAILADLQGLGAAPLGVSGGEPLGVPGAELATVARQRDDLLARGVVTPEAWLKVYRASRWAARRLAFRNPGLACDGLLFVRRHHPQAMHQCARRLGAFSLPGGGIYRLRNLRAEGEPTVTCLTAGRFPPGVFGRPDLSADGKRIVFGYARERETTGEKVGYEGVSEATAVPYSQHQIGPCEAFQVWEMALDGKTPPRRLSTGPAENSDPLYLPDGRIAFMSHRAGGLVQCGDWALAYCLYAMKPDGTDVRQLTVSKDGEWDPFLLQDGTVGYTRWEYVMKFWSPIQMLWSVRPDGTNARMIYGSDLSRAYPYPLNYAAARQVPGSSKLVCIGSAHHNTGAGPLCLVDMAIGPAEASGLKRVSPVRFVETPDQQPDNGWYDCPYPLSEKYFLASYSLSPQETDTRGYGLYLVDIYGGRELIYRDRELSALFPTPLRPRRLPPVLPEVVQGTRDQCGELLIQDVHAGLPEAMRGQGRYVQVVECHERRIHTSPYAMEVGPDSGFETKTVLGTVPVEPDGSAYFRVPAGRSVFFSILDQSYQALHTMRSVTAVQAGERTACVGCHEGYRRVPANRRLLAAGRPPSDITPPPWGVQPMAFADVVQPVLDRNCVRCHSGEAGRDRAPDLSARERRPFMGVNLPASYYNLRAYVRHAPILQYFLPPGSFGSRVSPVTALLAKGHHGVELASEDWRRLCAWIDCNAPGIGDYAAADLASAEVRFREAAETARKSVRAGRVPTPQRREALAGKLAPGERLVCYLDCGPEAQDGPTGGPIIREVRGTPYRYGAAEMADQPWYDDISFDGREVVHELTGLRKDRHYRLGFSWWDHNAGGREEAVTAGTPDGQRVALQARTRLPAWSGLGQRPEERVVAVPPGLSQAETLRIAFTNESGAANAVVSEVWLIEETPR